MKVKITAETANWRGGSAVHGDVVDVPQSVADYYLANGYAVLPDAEPSPEPIVAKVKRKYTRKKKAD